MHQDPAQVLRGGGAISNSEAISEDEKAYILKRKCQDIGIVLPQSIPYPESEMIHMTSRETINLVRSKPQAMAMGSLTSGLAPFL